MSQAKQRESFSERQAEAMERKEIEDEQHRLRRLEQEAQKAAEAKVYRAIKFAHMFGKAF